MKSNAFSECQRYCAAREKLNKKADDTDLSIRIIAMEREKKLQALGQAQAEGGDVEKAMAEYAKTGLSHDAAVEAKRYLTGQLSKLVNDSTGPLDTLETEVAAHRDSCTVELQAELVKATEAFCAAARCISAYAAALGVTGKLATLQSLPGITGPITVTMDWRADTAATKVYQQHSEPLTVIAELKQLKAELANRLQLANGRTSERPAFEAVCDHPSFDVLRRVNLGNEVYEPGSILPNSAVNRGLLGQLYRGGWLAVRHRSAA